VLISELKWVIKVGGNDVDTKRFVIHLGHCDEHSTASEKRHELDEHRTSFVAQAMTFTSVARVVNWKED